MIILRLKDIRTLEVRTTGKAGVAVNRVADETITLEIRDDFADVIKATQTKPAFVGPPPGAPLREVILGHGDIPPGSSNGVKDPLLLAALCAAIECELGIEDSEITGEVDVGIILNILIEVLGDATSIEVDGGI